MLTKLEAVNQILDAVDEDPVSSLTSGLPDAEAAERYLDRVVRTVLAKGWHENTDEDFALQPDISNEILVPDNVLRIDSASSDAVTDVVTRRIGGVKKLYDRENKTYEFTSAIKVDIVWWMEFEDLTPELQMYIAAKAAKEYQEGEMGSVALDSFTVRSEQEAWASLQDAEAERADANALRDNYHCAYITHRNAPRRIT